MNKIGRQISWIDIPLTGGNIRNSHFYLRAASHLLPADCIGGGNKGSAAKKIRVQFVPGMLAECDVAGDKMILRRRAEVRDFFKRTEAKVGDCVRFCRVGDYDFETSLKTIL